MVDKILPSVGASGYYELKTPLDTLILPGERYTCLAIRRISEYMANNEDVKADIYDAQQIPESDYELDLVADMEIVSLQSSKGHWVYAPARYIVGYPSVNGILYRTVTITAALPAIPAARDLSFLTADITNLITDVLGIVPTIKLIETSKVMQVPKDKHDAVQAARAAVSNGKVTDRSRYASLLVEHQRALDKIAELEAYLLANA